MPTEYFVNLTSYCNERCVFCAAELARPAKARWISLDRLAAWLEGDPPRLADRVLVAGGEPTLHPEFHEAIQRLSATCVDIRLFTNGLRLADMEFARRTVAAGVTRFEIALYGADDATHDAVTGRPGSHATTLSALHTLGSLRQELSFALHIRLLVARQTVDAAPAIVQLIAERVGSVDGVSINRLIRSNDAVESAAAVSWADARGPVNAAARMVRQHGFDLDVWSLPLCVLEGDIAAQVCREVRQGVPQARPDWRRRYLDPLVADQGWTFAGQRHRPALPACCRTCDYVSICQRVEPWYLDEFGESGLTPVLLGAAWEGDG